MSYGVKLPALTVGELIEVLRGMPEDGHLSTVEYSDDFAITQGTYYKHITGISPEGDVYFSGSDIDFFIADEDADFDDDIHFDGSDDDA